MDRPAHGRWAAGPDRQLDQRHLYAARTAGRPRHKEFYTKEEAAAVEKERIAQFNSQAADDLHYDNAIWQNENYEKGLSSLRTSLVFDPPDGRIPALTEEARRRPLPPQAGSPDRRTDSIEDRTLAERCITWGNDGPPIMPVGYNANLDIFQGPGYVVVRTEMIHSARLIPLDAARPHVGQEHPAVERRLARPLGRRHARRRDDELQRSGRASGTRRRRVQGDRALHARRPPTRSPTRSPWTIPTTWTRPWTAEMPLLKTQGPIYEYACHEGNYGLANILRAARVEEKSSE